VSTTDYGSYAEIIIQGVSGGSCLLTANQPGNAQYLPAPQASLSVPVGIAQTITFDTYPVAIHANIVETLVATASSGLPVTFTSVENNNGECRISGNQLTQISYSAGATCSVTASQAGNAQYAPAASVTVKIPVGGGEVITFSGYPSSLSGPGSTGTLTATVSNSGLTVTFSSLTPSICTVSGTTVTAVSAGQCEVAADQAGGTGTNGYLYGAATEVTKTIPVGTSQTITFGSPPLVLEGGSGTLTATSSSGLPVIFGTTTPSVCIVVASEVTGIGVGQCIVTADQPGNAQYLPAPEVIQTIGI
jgi:hypothetical protein